jgi:hypothetical protein
MCQIILELFGGYDEINKAEKYKFYPTVITPILNLLNFSKISVTH